MRRSILLGAAALLAAVACNKEAQAPVSAPEGRQVVVSAQKAADTKVIYQNDAEFCWGKTETIGIGVYKPGDDGYNPWVAPFDLTYGAGTANGKFSATLDEGVEYGYVAVYPYAAENVWVNEMEVYMQPQFDVAEGKLNFYLPPFYRDQQKGTDDIFSARMPMAAKLDMSGDKGSFAFKNVGGLVKVTLTDLPSNARYFKLWAKSGGNLSGMFTMNIDGIGTSTLGEGGHANTVELQLAQGVPADETMELYFPVPCGTFVFGIGVYSDEGIVLEKDGSAQNTISRGTILRMPAISVNDQPVNPTDPGEAGYFLIGEFGSYNWDHDVVLEKVNDDWFVARNIAASPNGQIAFKFRSSTDWNTCSQFGAAMPYAKQVNVLFNLEANSGLNSNIVLAGTGTYDVYFGPLEEQAFILNAGAAFAVPSTVETKPEQPAGTSAWSLIGVIGGTNWNTDFQLQTKDGSKWHFLKDVNITGEFKFRKDNAWGTNLGSGVSNPETITTGTVYTNLAANGGNFKLSAAGNYDVYLYPDGNSMYVVSAGGAAPAE